MLGPALSWLASARPCFDDPCGGLTRGLLTSVFALVVGRERVFHLDQRADAGFARLTGGRRCPSRYRVGGWRRHRPWYEVEAFCRRTSPWHLISGEGALVSYDEHTSPRWTHKFHIQKGYVTTRNKYMRGEKLFYGYDLASGRYLTVRATPGNWGLQDLAVPLTRPTLERGQPEYLHALFDAGAGQSDAGVRALGDLVQEDDPRLDVTLRACRYPHRVGLGKALPAEHFEVLEEPGPYVGAPPKEIRRAETTTVRKDESPEQAVRTVICREVVPGPKQDRWHPLFTTERARPLDVLTAFRGRQNHEPGYRVGVYDEFLDAVPCGYAQDSPDPKRPRFHRGLRPGQPGPQAAAVPPGAVADDRLAGGAGVQRRGGFRGGAGGGLRGLPHPHVAADVLQPPRGVVRDAGGVGGAAGPVRRPGGLDPGDRCVQRGGTSFALVGGSTGSRVTNTKQPTSVWTVDPHC
jgi:hypothetical protein